MKSFVARLLIFLAFAAFVIAQTERGSITGVVTDSTGAAVTNQDVVITNQATNTSQRVTTTTTGEYNAANLAPGNYRIEIGAPGFKRFVESGITLTAAGTVRIDAQLEVGAISDSVEVVAQAAQMQTEDARITTAVENRMVDQLPLVVGGALRSAFDLVTIAPESKGSGNSVSLGGGQAAAWSATLDGLSVNTNRSADATETAYVTPSVESITEFAVDTNGFKAEFGQAGGGVITFVSKSGTNSYHGTAYDFLRNDDLDARGFFAPQRSVYKQNDFGVTLGGPVRIPKLYNGRDRTFFFVSYEGFRNRIGANGTIVSVPTPEMYKGDFSNWVNSANKQLTIYDPDTTATVNGTIVRSAFPNNQIPASRFSAVSQSIMPYAQKVLPNRPGLVPGQANYVKNNYVTQSGVTETPTDKGSVKIDHNFGSNHHLGFFYNKTAFTSEPGASGPSGLPVPLWNGQITIYNASDYRMSYDWTISPRLLNHFSIGGNKFNKDSFSPNVGGNWKSKVCIKNAVDCNVNFPQRLVFRVHVMGQCGRQRNRAAHVVLQRRSELHPRRPYPEVRVCLREPARQRLRRTEYRGSGDLQFSGDRCSRRHLVHQRQFLRFVPAGRRPIAAPPRPFAISPQTYRYHGFYAQDDWRVHEALMVNLGLRYEFTRPPISRAISIRTSRRPRQSGGEQLSRSACASPVTVRAARNAQPGARLVRSDRAARRPRRTPLDTTRRPFAPAWAARSAA